MKMVVFSLTLVRHGETAFNRLSIIQGHTDVPLSKLGEQQAELVAKRLQYDRFTHVFTSDLSRAAQTAKIITDKNKVCRYDLEYDKRLRERKFGVAEGKSSKELLAAAKKARRKVVDYTPVGAETVDQVRGRVISFFEDLCKKCQSYDESEDSSYTPGKIKRRHGGSLGRNSGPNKRLEGSKRSQSFCGSGNIQNIINEMNLEPELDEDELNLNEKQSSYYTPGDEITYSMQPFVHTIPKGLETVSSSLAQYDENSLHECYQSGSEKCSSGVNLKSFQSQNGSISDSSSQSDSEASALSFPSTDYSDKICITHQQKIPNSDRKLGDGEGKDSVTVNLSHQDATVSAKDDKLKVDSSSGCPNISLSPSTFTFHQVTSLSSMSSGRNSSFDELDSVPVIAADILVVSHGGYLKETIRYFVDQLDCEIPGVNGHSLRVCPNCSISKFIVSLDERTGKPSLTCVSIHDKDHLIGLNHTEAVGTM